jgi:hypothetical protein
LLIHRKDAPIEAVHLLDHLKPGEKDDSVVEWLASLKPHVIAVSGDTGAQSKPGEPRLDRLCPVKKVTSIFLTPRLCQRHGLEKIRMIMVCLPAIERAYRADQGSRFRLESYDNDLYRLKPWPLPASTEQFSNK